MTNALNSATSSGVPVEAALGALEDRERAVGGDARDLADVELELVEALQHVGGERIVGLDEHEHVLAVTEDGLEALVRRVRAIGLHDQTIERVVLLHLERVVDARRQERGEDGDDDPARGDDAEKLPLELGLERRDHVGHRIGRRATCYK